MTPNKSKLEEELLTLSYKHDNEITLAIDDIISLFQSYAKEELVPEERKEWSTYRTPGQNQDYGFNKCRQQVLEKIGRMG